MCVYGHTSIITKSRAKATGESHNRSLALSKFNPIERNQLKYTRRFNVFTYVVIVSLTALVIVSFFILAGNHHDNGSLDVGRDFQSLMGGKRSKTLACDSSRTSKYSI